MEMNTIVVMHLLLLVMMSVKEITMAVGYGCIALFGYLFPVQIISSACLFRNINYISNVQVSFACALMLDAKEIFL